MKAPKLTHRLKLVASLVRDQTIVADIGTDHAFLPVWLVQTGKCKGAIACDINSGPLESAQKTIELYQSGESIQTRLCNGLDDVHADEVDDIIIAGMGGVLISDILSRAVWVRDPRIQLVLQPMTAQEELREYLCKEGFNILHEDLAKEGNKLYLVISAAFSGEKIDADRLFNLVGKIPQSGSELANEYLTKQVKRLHKRLNGLTIGGKNSVEVDELRCLAEEIEKLIECRM